MNWVQLSVVLITIFTLVSTYKQNSEIASIPAILEVRYAPDGESLAIGYGDLSSDALCSGYAITIEGELDSTFFAACPVSGLAFSPDASKFIAVDIGGNEYRWDIATGTLLHYGFTNGDPYLEVDWRNDSRFNLLGGVVSVYTPTTSIRVIPTLIDTVAFSAAALSPDGLTIASASKDYSAKVWQVSDLNVMTSYKDHIEPIRAIQWRPDEQQIASGDDSGQIRIWNARTGITIIAINAHSEPVTELAWHPDGTQLASASEDGTVKIWDAATGDLLETLTYTGPVYALDWRPDGQYIAYGGADISGNPPQVEIVAVSTVAPTPTLTPTAPQP